MKIIITGAFGFLGRYLIDHLKNSHQLVGLSRNSCQGIDGVQGLITDYSQESLKSHLQGCDAIIHLAAGRPNNTTDAELQNNVTVDFNLFNVAYELGIKNIVFMSSRGVYGSQPAPWHETHAVKPDNMYALAKAQSETVADFFNRKGLNIKILRIAQLAGLGEYKGNAISSFIESAYSNKPIHLTVDGINREYLYVKDLVSAINCALVAVDKHGLFNVGSGCVLSLRQIAETIAEAFGRQNSVVDNIQKTLSEYSLMDSTLFRREFDWQPAFSFKTAAEDMVNMLNNKELVKFYGLSAD